MKKTFYSFIYIILIVSIFGYYFYIEIKEYLENQKVYNSYKMSNIPDYNGTSYIYINNNEPEFNLEDKEKCPFEEYYDLDDLGRCTGAYACLSKELMPTEERSNISHIKPSGWKISRYDFIEGEYLFNRCHLIAYSLSGENDNVNNLITCTRYLNAISMLEFEEKVANYIRRTDNHVLYRVKPIFDKTNLIAKGVQMEAYSIEDNGEGIKYNVFLYNIEPRVHIDYLDGSNYLVN